MEPREPNPRSVKVGIRVRLLECALLIMGLMACILVEKTLGHRSHWQASRTRRKKLYGRMMKRTAFLDCVYVPFKEFRGVYNVGQNNEDCVLARKLKYDNPAKQLEWPMNRPEKRSS